MSRLDDLRRQAVELDTKDPLARWRDEFVIDDPDLAYLDGNSLGMTPRRTIHRIHEVMATEWAEGLISSWEHWLDLPLHVGDELAPIIGAGPGEVVCDYRDPDIIRIGCSPLTTRHTDVVRVFEALETLGALD